MVTRRRRHLAARLGWGSGGGTLFPEGEEAMLSHARSPATRGVAPGCGGHPAQGQLFCGAKPASFKRVRVEHPIHPCAGKMPGVGGGRGDVLWVPPLRCFHLFLFF